MIHTITLSPSIDLTLTCSSINLGEVQQLADPVEYAGGKGMNVARALDLLGQPVMAWVFLGKERGKHWKRLAESHDIALEVVELVHETRQNIKIHEESNHRETSLNFTTGEFEPEPCELFIQRLRERLHPGDGVVLAGSPCRSVPFNWWQELVQTIQQAGAKLAVDVSGPALPMLAQCNPWLIKINRYELNEWLGTAFVSLNEVYNHFRDKDPLQTNLIITDGAAGALAWTTQKRVYRQRAAKVTLRSSVGAGDAWMAGFLDAWLTNEGDWEGGLRWGAATAAGAIEQMGTQFATLSRVREISAQI